jgi:hypothetical protein
MGRASVIYRKAFGYIQEGLPFIIGKPSVIYRKGFIFSPIAFISP